ncbi:hypothetical protein B5P44_11575 [Mycobacterium sp. CBMA 213]|nr:hypothetical protein [Mycolicibacterium sp. CBMA 213]
MTDMHQKGRFMSRPQLPWLNMVVVMCTAIGLVVGGIVGGPFPVSTTYRGAGAADFHPATQHIGPQK